MVVGKKCTNCGAPIGNAADRFCEACGAPVTPARGQARIFIGLGVGLAVAAVAVAVLLLLGRDGEEAPPPAADATSTTPASSPSATSGAVAQVWEIPLEGGYHAFGPAADDEHVYVANDKGLVTAFSPADGERVWTADLGERPTWGPVPGEGMVFIATQRRVGFAGTITALTSSAGKVVWTARVASPPSNMVLDGTHLFVSGGGTNVFEARSGRVVWKERSDIGPLGVGEGVVITSTLDRVVARRATDGRVLWGTTVGGDGGLTPPAISDGVAVLLDLDGNIRAHDPRTGKKLWGIVDAGLGRGPTIGHGAIYVPDETGALTALDLETGDELWIEGDPFSPHVAVVDDYLYTTGLDLEVRDPSTGSVVASAPLGGSPLGGQVGQLAVAGDRVYVGWAFDDPHLTAYEIDTGELNE